jgi:heat shock protein HslJ
MRKTTLILVLCLGAGLTQAQSLTKTRWIFSGIYEDKSKENLLKDTLMKALLYFNSDSAYTGVFCNRYFGKCKTGENKSLSIDRPTASRRYCDIYSELEGKLFTGYQNVKRYEIKNSELTLLTKDGYQLVFKKE